MKKDDKSLIDVETTGERCCHLSWRSPLNCSLCTFIGMKHISLTIYVCHTNVFEADNIYKKTSPNVISPIFLFHSGAPPMTMLTAGAPTDLQLPARASSFSEHILVRTSLPRCVCEIDAGPPPLCCRHRTKCMWCLSPIFFLGFFSRLPFLALLSSVTHCGE